MEFSIQSSIEVAHYMPSFPEGHPNRRMHGHSYLVTVTIRSGQDTDMIEDFDEAQGKLNHELKELCHSCANEWPLKTPNPTMENMCLFLWERFRRPFPQLHRVTLERPTLKMTVSYEGNV